MVHGFPRTLSKTVKSWFLLGGAGNIKLSKELQSPDANYLLKSGTTEWKINYIGGTDPDEAEEIEPELVLEPMKFIISGASDEQVTVIGPVYLARPRIRIKHFGSYYMGHIWNIIFLVQWKIYTLNRNRDLWMKKFFSRYTMGGFFCAGCEYRLRHIQEPWILGAWKW